MLNKRNCNMRNKNVEKRDTAKKQLTDIKVLKCK